MLRLVSRLVVHVFPVRVLDVVISWQWQPIDNSSIVTAVLGILYKTWNLQQACRGACKMTFLLRNAYQIFPVLGEKNYNLSHTMGLISLQNTCTVYKSVSATQEEENNFIPNIYYHFLCQKWLANEPLSNPEIRT